VTHADQLHQHMERIPHITGVVVWKLGDAPVGDLGSGNKPVAPGLLSAGIGSIEHVVESIGLGQIEELWFLTDAVQGLAVRVGDWQAVLIGDLELDVDGARDEVTDILTTASHAEPSS
jgi:hypothetical protein